MQNVIITVLYQHDIFGGDITSKIKFWKVEIVVVVSLSTDEKEKQDPLAFRDAIIQGLQEIGNNDLDQVSNLKCDNFVKLSN